MSVILAAGRGTRMGATSRNKVCHDIAGRPAIVRALETYTACGIGPHVIVVGDRAPDVLTTVSQAGFTVLYAFQNELRGTGHATKQGVQGLRDVGYDGALLVVAGDKVIERAAVEKLLRSFLELDCDVAFLVGRRQGHPDLGRIVTDTQGGVLACVEQRDLRQRRALARVRVLARWAGESAGGAHDLRAAVRALLQDEIKDEGKASVAFGALWTRLSTTRPLAADELMSLVPETAGRFDFGDAAGRKIAMTADEVDNSPWVNLSVYLFKARALYYGLDRLTSDNAQGEEYLTDVIHHLQSAAPGGRRDFRLQAVVIDDARHAMAFNTPAELAEIEAYYKDRAPGDLRHIDAQ